MGKTLAKIIAYILVALALTGTVGLIYKFTNGFNEDFKTFYVEYNGKQILTTESKMTLQSENVHRFNVRYTFDKDDAEPKDYRVKIIPNLTRDFDFTVDGEKFIFSKIGELTAAFTFVKADTYFELYLPETLTLSEIIKTICNGTNVSIPADAETNNPYPSRLVISSYNDKVIYNIDFAFDTVKTPSADNDKTPTTPDNPDPVIPPAPIIPDVPSEPTKQSYAISWRVEGNDDNLITADLICPETAVANETVEFVVSLIGDYKSEVTKIAVYSGGNHYADIAVSESNNASNYYNTFSFIMPEGNVEIVVTIKAVVIGEYRNISYDTFGSGSLAAVNVYVADVAKPGDYVMVSISLAFDVENELQISRIVLQNADTGDEIRELEYFNEFCDFTMPDCDVVIVIYLMPV